MIRLFPARQSAERFDSLVEGGRHDASTSDLLELVGALRSVPRAQARPEFVADLREQLMVAARAELVAPAASSRSDVATRLTVPARHSRRERRVGVALGAFAIVGATASMAVASQNAIPGDPLYPIKRIIENTQTGLNVGDDAKGEAILGNASGRLDEVDQLTQKPNPDAQLVGHTLNTFSDQATEAGDLLLSEYDAHGNAASIETLQAFTSQSLQILGTLEAAIPLSAEDSLLNATLVLTAIDAAADQACPDCATGITEIPPQLLASGQQALDQASQALASGQLSGTMAASEGAGDQQGKGDKGDKPSGLNPPDAPISIPPATVAPTDTTGATNAPDPTGVGNALPSANANTGTGHGGKPKPTPSVDLTPVTEVVNDVVNGAVNGVNDLLNGLAGK